MIGNAILCLIVGLELAQLQRDARKTQARAFADGTVNNYCVQWVKYLKFCLYFGLFPFPASMTMLVWFTQFLSRKLKVHGSILAGILGTRKLHELLGFHTEGFDGFFLKLTLKGLRRLNLHVVKRAKLVTPTILKHIYQVTNHEDLLEMVFWACSLLAFLLLFRKSNLVPDLVNGFDP